jgi:hypothetical protein
VTITLANAGAKDRPDTDYYPTPPEVTIALLDYLNLPLNTTIWEPACGQGHMVKVMVERGYDVDASDILTGKDFLTSGDLAADWIISNPPFYIAEDFIRHAAELWPCGFAFLLKSQYWHSSKRLKLFNGIRPTAILPLTWRPDFLFGAKSGSPTMEVLWTVWGRKDVKETIYQPLSRPSKTTGTGNCLASLPGMG